MKKAIIHIGTEKTGSTSIQDYLHKHRGQLHDANLEYPKSAGLISNFHLVIYAHSSADTDLLNLGGIAGDQASIDSFKQDFVSAHTEEVTEFQLDNPTGSTMVYSSEHFHSRITSEQDMQVLKAFMSTLYDEVDIVVYLRRQDKLAMSAHNTAIQGGNTRRFDFDKVNVRGPYYDYATALERWAAVFGEQHIKVRLFEPARLHRNNVVADFCQLIGLPCTEKTQSHSRNNERLSFSAQETLLAFNELEDESPLLRGNTKLALRQELIELLHSMDDEHGKVLPGRAQAERFYDHFKVQNQAIADKWLSGDGFDDSFAEYPEEADTLPSVDREWLLKSALSQCLGGVTPMDMMFFAATG